MRLLADHQIPQGTVVRLNNGNNLQLCTTVMGLPRFAPTTKAARDRSKSIINVTVPVAPQSISCNETEPQGKLCTCYHLQYSPGAVVGCLAGASSAPHTADTGRPTKASKTRGLLNQPSRSGNDQAKEKWDRSSDPASHLNMATFRSEDDRRSFGPGNANWRF